MSDRLLVIEDSRADAELLELALREAHVDVWIDAVTDGGEALQRLHDMAVGLERLPALVLLDLNLPGRSGREILQHIRTTQSLCELPIAVVTASATSRQEIEKIGVDAYFIKPTRWSEMLEMVEEIRELLPPPPARPRGYARI